MQLDTNFFLYKLRSLKDYVYFLQRDEKVLHEEDWHLLLDTLRKDPKDLENKIIGLIGKSK